MLSVSESWNCYECRVSFRLSGPRIVLMKMSILKGGQNGRSIYRTLHSDARKKSCSVNTSPCWFASLMPSSVTSIDGAKKRLRDYSCMSAPISFGKTGRLLVVMYWNRFSAFLVMTHHSTFLWPFNENKNNKQMCMWGLTHVLRLNFPFSA